MCPQQQQHPELVGKKEHDAGPNRFSKGEPQQRWEFFMEVDREGELSRQAKEIYIFLPTLWLLIAPSVHYYTSFIGHMIQL